MRPIIRVENLGKRYRIGTHDAAYSTLREALVATVRSPLKALGLNGHSRDETIWALRDVGFEITQGEVVGIIGRNGAGKSTLLKVLSRITEPTTGRVELFGRVGSLLEVGTGFHPELTGRENIFLNGSILGMTRVEIQEKFDEIVAFAEVEKFIDTPVKRYSSGMYVRLAFAVAAHLQSEILLVDEVLAVGDAEFQKKCLGKMHEVSGQGRTVLFVSHNMAAVQSLCTRAILLREGAVANDGNVHSVVLEYLQSGMNQAGERTWSSPANAPGDAVARLRAVRARNADGLIGSEFNLTEAFSIEVEFWVLQEGHQLDVGLYVYNEAGGLLFVTGDFQDPHWNGRPRPIGIHRSICNIPGDFLNEGTISILAGISTNPHTLHAVERDAITLRLIDDFRSGGARGNYTREWPGGLVRPRMEWSFEFEAPRKDHVLDDDTFKVSRR
jgi:lipopolysaccharide transport system ATP-binding protein